jgi:hypothetical protein
MTERPRRTWRKPNAARLSFFRKTAIHSQVGRRAQHLELGGPAPAFPFSLFDHTRVIRV